MFDDSEQLLNMTNADLNLYMSTSDMRYALRKNVRAIKRTQFFEKSNRWNRWNPWRRNTQKMKVLQQWVLALAEFAALPNSSQILGKLLEEEIRGLRHPTRVAEQLLDQARLYAGEQGQNEPIAAPVAAPSRRIPPPATPQAIRSLPTMEGEAILKTRDEVTCYICCEQYQCKSIVKELPCGHNFHASCVDCWLSKHRTCPLCRYELIPDDMCCSIEHHCEEEERFSNALTSEDEMHNMQYQMRQKYVEEEVHRQFEDEAIPGSPIFLSTDERDFMLQFV